MTIKNEDRFTQSVSIHQFVEDNISRPVIDKSAYYTPMTDAQKLAGALFPKPGHLRRIVKFFKKGITR